MGAHGREPSLSRVTGLYRGDPASRRGAVELVARYSHLDLRDRPIDGGLLDKWHFGANWWISQQWKAGVSYGDADLDRGGTAGKTRLLLLRVQWYY